MIAYGRGGCLETVRGPGERPAMGTFFARQEPDAVADAVRGFEAALPAIRPSDCRTNAERFATERFRAEFSSFVDDAWARREVAVPHVHN